MYATMYNIQNHINNSVIVIPGTVDITFTEVFYQAVFSITHVTNSSRMFPTCTDGNRHLMI